MKLLIIKHYKQMIDVLVDGVKLSQLRKLYLKVKFGEYRVSELSKNMRLALAHYDSILELENDPEKFDYESLIS